MIRWYQEQLRYKQPQLETGTSTYPTDSQAHSLNSLTEQLLSDVLDEMIDEDEVSKLSDILLVRYKRSGVKDKIIDLVKHPSKYPNLFCSDEEIS